MKVFKYKMEIQEYMYLSLPKGAQILSVQEQFQRVCIWALVDPDAILEMRCFRLAGTGHEIAEPQERLRFIGTFQMHGGVLVFHLFELSQ